MPYIVNHPIDKVRYFIKIGRFNFHRVSINVILINFMLIYLRLRCVYICISIVALSKCYYSLNFSDIERHITKLFSSISIFNIKIRIIIIMINSAICLRMA